jgi:UDP-galactose transporter B1
MIGSHGERAISRPPRPVRTVLRRSVEFSLCAVGIYATYLGYGVLHERLYWRLYRTRDGAAYDRFRYPLFLVFWQCLCNASVSFFSRKIARSTPRDERLRFDEKRRLYSAGSAASSRFYALVAACHVVAMCCAFGALIYVPYPLQVLAKSSKMIPIMLTGAAMRRKRYTLTEIIRVLLITFGVVQFSRQRHSKESTSRQAAVPGPQSGGGHQRHLGWALLLMSLVMDGIVGPLQEHTRALFDVEAIHFMFAQNSWATFWMTLVLLATGQGVAAWSFLRTHPSVWRDLFGFGLLSAMGQHFVFYVVCHFSALTLAMITTTRKLFSVLLSIVVFAHRLSVGQALGMCCAFAGLLWEAIASLATRNVAGSALSGKCSSSVPGAQEKQASGASCRNTSTSVHVGEEG